LSPYWELLCKIILILVDGFVAFGGLAERIYIIARLGWTTLLATYFLNLPTKIRNGKSVMS
jgi:hypothetical protein